MHQACHDFVRDRLTKNESKIVTVIEYGSRDVNGSVKDLLGDVTYVGVDCQPGENVDVVMDGADYEGQADLVLCLETLEHAPDVDGLVSNIVDSVNPGGLALVTCATDPRAAHSGVDGGTVRYGEHYRNVDIDEIKTIVEAKGAKITFQDVDRNVGDLRCEIRVD